MNRVITSLLALVISVQLYATQQEPEKFHWKGQYSSIHNNEFLEEYLLKNKIQIPGKYSNSTALWRGYIGTYSVVDEFLTLTNVEIYEYAKGSNEETLKSIYAQLPSQMKNLKIEWFSGLLILPYGDMIISDDYYRGYANPYYFVFEISKGKVIWEFDFTLKEFEAFKDQQFKAYQKTDQYKALKAEIMERKRKWELYKLTDDYKKTAQYKAEQENGIRVPKWTDEEDADRSLKDSMFDDIKKLF